MHFITDILFFCCFLAFPVTILYCVFLTKYDVLQITISNILFLSIFCFSYIGIAILYFGLDANRLGDGVDDKSIIASIYWYEVISILALIVGFIAASKVGLENSHTKKESRVSLWRLKLVLVCCWPLFLISIAYYISLNKNIALFIALGFFDGESGITRGEMTNAFAGYHYFKFVNHDLLTFFMLMSFGLNRVGKGSLFLFLAYFFLCSFSVLLTTEKSPFVWTLISLLFYSKLLEHQQSLRFSHLIFPAFILIAVLTTFYILFMQVGIERLDVAFYSIFSRIFAGSIQPAYYYIEFFQNHEYLMGQSFPNPGGLMPFTGFNVTQEIYKYAHPVNYSSGIVGSMPTIFWAEAFSNFGPLGVVAVSGVVGVAVRLLDNTFSNFHADVIISALFVWLIVHIKDLSVTGFSQYLADTYLVGVLLVYFVLILFVRKIR